MLIVPSSVSLLRLVRPFVGFLLDDAHSSPFYVSFFCSCACDWCFGLVSIAQRLYALIFFWAYLYVCETAFFATSL